MFLVNVLRRLGRMSTFLMVLTAAKFLWVSGVLSKCLAVLMGAAVPWVRSCQSPRPFCFFLRVRLANKSRLILVGAAVSFVRVLATATVVVVFSAVVRVMPDMSTELPHIALKSRHLRGEIPACSA